jgi:hypothetical protein
MSIFDTSPKPVDQSAIDRQIPCSAQPKRVFVGFLPIRQILCSNLSVGGRPLSAISRQEDKPVHSGLIGLQENLRPQRLAGI